MYRNIFIILFSFFLNFSSFSQTTVIKFSKISSQQNLDTLNVGLYFPLASLNSMNFIPSKIIGFKKNGDTVTTIIKYMISKPSIVLIGDGFMHETYLYPNDTLQIFLGQYTGKKIFLKDNIPAPWSFNFTYFGNHKNESLFFDSLAYVAGAIHNDFSNFNYRIEDINKYIEKEKIKYGNRIEYLNQFNSKNKLSKKFYYLALNEIKSAFFYKIFTAMIQSKPSLEEQEYLKKEILKFVGQVGNENEMLYNNTIFYSLFLRSQKLDSLNHIYSKVESDSFIYHAFTNFKLIKNTNIKDYELTHILKYSKIKDSSIINLLLKDYRSTCKTHNYVSLIDSIYNISLSKTEIGEAGMLNSNIINIENTVSFFKTLLGKRPVVVDCWATWCNPCLIELPFVKKFEVEYKGLIDFIYLSFDRNKKEWIDKSKQLDEVSNSYLLINNFKSEVALYFQISSIPHYLVFDKAGKLVTNNASRPSNKSEFKELLDKLIIEK